MIAKIIIISNKFGEINKFLTEFYSKEQNLENVLSWQKHFSNPVEISDLIATFTDSFSDFELSMWISLDEDVYIKISNSNSNDIIKYLFERYPY